MRNQRPRPRIEGKSNPTVRMTRGTSSQGSSVIPEKLAKGALKSRAQAAKDLMRTKYRELSKKNNPWSQTCGVDDVGVET